MKNIERDDDVKRQRSLGATIQSAILASFVAGIAAIGVQARAPQQLALDCAYDPPRIGTLTDAVSEIPAICGATAAAASPATAHRVPEAALALDPLAPAEALPPTF